MCEIHFVSNSGRSLSQNQVRLFLRMMKGGSISNNDAWGMQSDKFYAREKGSYTDYERGHKGVFGTIMEASPTFIIGHNRLKTKGSASNLANNHPFCLGKWYLFHNGVISNDSWLKETFKLKYGEETDSAVILPLIEYLRVKKNMGDLDAICATAQMLKGFFSVFIYDSDSGKMYYFRNSLATFYKLERGGKCIASTKWTRINSRAEKVKANVIYEIDGGVWKQARRFKKPKRAEKVTYYNPTLGVWSDHPPARPGPDMLGAFWKCFKDILLGVETSGHRIKVIDYKPKEIAGECK